MRTRTVAILLTASYAAGGAGCKRRSRPRSSMTEEEAPQLASIVHVADPRSSAQLVSGFYDMEQNAWRWTAGKFAVVLRVPRGAAQKGAMLHLKFSDSGRRDRAAEVGGRSAAMIEGTALKPQTYTQAGEFTYDPEVPASLLARDSAQGGFRAR